MRPAGVVPPQPESILTDAIRHDRKQAWINTSNKWISSSDSSYSICIPVSVGDSLKIEWDNTASSTVGGIFRYGFCDYSTPNAGGISLTGCVRTSPQATPSATVTASKAYLVIQVSGNSADITVVYGYLSHLNVYKLNT